MGLVEWSGSTCSAHLPQKDDGQRADLCRCIGMSLSGSGVTGVQHIWALGIQTNASPMSQGVEKKFCLPRWG